jgi:hypothetical protein
MSPSRAALRLLPDAARDSIEEASTRRHAATLSDNGTAAAFKKLLPLSVTMTTRSQDCP